MTTTQLQSLGLPADATSAQIDARLHQLTSAEGKATQLEQRASAPEIQLGEGIVCPPDVDPEDVIWRIKAGLRPHQAVEVARAQIVEDARSARKAETAAS